MLSVVGCRLSVVGCQKGRAGRPRPAHLSARMGGAHEARMKRERTAPRREKGKSARPAVTPYRVARPLIRPHGRRA